VYSRGGTAEAGGPIALPHGDSLDGSEGLVLRILGDSQPYTLIVRTGANLSATPAGSLNWTQPQRQ
jgi:hypothetical protein